MRDGRKTSPGVVVLIAPILVVSFALPLVDSRYLLLVHGLAALLLLKWLPVVLRDRRLMLLWAGAALWCGAQGLSKFVNQKDPGAAVGFVGLLIMSVVSLLVSLHRDDEVPLPAIVILTSVGWLALETLGAGAALNTDNPWKYGLATPTLVLCLACLWHINAGPLSTATVLVLFSAVSWSSESRFFLILGVVLLVGLGVREMRAYRPRPSSRLRPLILAAVAALVVYAMYPTLATSGLLGDRAKSDQERVEMAGANFLVANRAEMFQAAYLTAQNPLLGVGAKGRVPPGQAAETLGWLHRLGVENSPAKDAYLLDAYATGQGYSPHSSMLVSSVQAGLGALGFWLVALTMVGMSAVRGMHHRHVAHLILSWFLSGLSLWNAFFSPLAPTTYLTFIAAIFLAVASPQAVSRVGRRSIEGKAPPLPLLATRK